MSTPAPKPRLLRLVPYSHRGLRRATKPVQFPLSAFERRMINNMCYSIQPAQLRKVGAAWDGAVGMAANQWGLDKRVFLYCPDGDTVDGLEVIFNPRYEPLATDPCLPPEAEAWEGCFSIPLATGRVRRYAHILATYQDIDGATHTRTLHDWEARVWQHENDHLDGFLYEAPQHGTCLEMHRFTSRAEVDAFYESLAPPDDGDEDDIEDDAPEE